jgi:hypothetical protein
MKEGGKDSHVLRGKRHGEVRTAEESKGGRDTHILSSVEVWCWCGCANLTLIIHKLIKHAMKAIWIRDMLILLEYFANATMNPLARACAFIFFECPF